MDYCVSTSVEGAIATTIVTIATTTLGEITSIVDILVVSLDMLKKNQDFWKPKSYNSIC